MYAIVKSGSREYKVAVGDIIAVDKLNLNVGEKVELPVIITVEDGKITLNNKLKAKAEVIEHFKDKKIVVFKYKAKKNERKKQGHRQSYTKIKIENIG